MSTVQIYIFLNTLIQVVRNWWWVPLPFILWKPFLFHYLWWRVDCWLSKQRMVILEIKLPKEIDKPIRAMEQVMAGIHGPTYHPPDRWEKWIDGQVQLSVSFEMVSIGGEVHFYIRFQDDKREAVEAAIYSQYPEVELVEVEDYTKKVPQSIPNKEWDLWATDYRPIKDDHYPIKTYPKFETEREATKEMIVDPVASLVEALAQMKPEEQFWIQITCEPISDDDLDGNRLSAWIDKGKELRDKLARRPGPAPAPVSIIEEAARIIITGQPTEPLKEKEEIIPPEMKLTPGEREILLAIEEKMSKPIFLTNIRFIYLGKRTVFFNPHFRVAFTFFNNYTTTNLNAIYPYGATLTKIKKAFFLPLNWIRPRRDYLRCRKIFRNYIRRLSPHFPRSALNILPRKRAQFMLNTEEMASLFHFPSKANVPSPALPRIESKKEGAPPDLPIE